MSQFIPIQLGIARPAPKKQAGGSASQNSSQAELSKEKRQEIFERDGYTCRCCGFQSLKFQEIHFLDSDTTNHETDNLITACSFCHQCFNLQDVYEMKSGVLLWLPEIPQYQLNHIARSIYIGRLAQGDIADVSRRALDVLMARRDATIRRLTTDDPNILSVVLSDFLTWPHYEQRAKKLDGLRLLPLERRLKVEKSGVQMNVFPQMLAYWRSKDGAYGGKMAQKWVSIYHDIARAA